MRLTKREIALLVFLIVIALLFIEYRFVVVPGLARYDTLLNQNSELEGKVNEINVNLAAAKTNQEKIDVNLAQIEKLSNNYLPALKADQLTLFTHEMMQRNGFLPSSYVMTPIQLTTVTPTTVSITDLVYQIKTLSKQFYEYNNEITNPTNSATDPGTEPTDTEPVLNDQVEFFSISITATTTYDLILQLLDDLQSYQKTVLISSFSMIPTEGNILTVNLTINYYGIVKLEDRGSLNDTIFDSWPRLPYVGHESDPFDYPVPSDQTEATSETTTETT